MSMASSVQTVPADNTPVAPPTPQEVNRKLSIHSKPVKISPSNANPPVSGTESDSDSFLSPDHSPLAGGHFGTGIHTHNIAHQYNHGHNHTLSMGLSASTSNKPLSSIAERRHGSGDEEEESDEDDDGDGDDWTPEQRGNYQREKKKQADECVIRTGYLWKKGERRKTWKKRWFVLRPAHLAFYKSSKEYQLLRLLDLSDVHSCTSVSLKRHANSFVLVSPTRTFYLQAESEQDMKDWVERVNDAREALMSTSTQNSIATPPIPIPISPSGSRHPNLSLSQSPTTVVGVAITPSPPSARGVGFAGPVTSDSDSEDAWTGANATSVGSVSISPAAATIVASPSKSKDPSKAILSGYLMKCRSKRRGWRKRWFVLTGEKLMYSASHMDTKRQRSIELPQILDALEYDLSHDRYHSGASSASSPPSGLVASVSPRHGLGDELHAQHEGDNGSGSGGAKYTFKIVTTKRALLLSAPSEEEEIKWLSAVRALIARRTHSPNAPLTTSVSPLSVGANSVTISGGGNGPDAGPPVASNKATTPVVNRRRSASGTSAVGREDHQNH